MASQRFIAGNSWTFTPLDLAVVAAVIGTLALLAAPSVATIKAESRVVRTRSDCLTIANAVVQFYRDTGVAPDGAAGAATGAHPTVGQDILVSRGDAPTELVPTSWTTGVVGSLADHLVTNTPRYPAATSTSRLGWVGPYLPTEPGADPWGHRYAVNISVFGRSPGPSTPGQVSAAVWVLSAGPNGTIDTPFTQPLADARLGGDDIGVRIQ